MSYISYSKTLQLSLLSAERVVAAITANVGHLESLAQVICNFCLIAEINASHWNEIILLDLLSDGFCLRSTKIISVKFI